MTWFRGRCLGLKAIRLWALPVWLALAGPWALPLRAQDQIHGRVEGSVSRYTGERLKGAAVRLVNLATEVETSRTTDSDGRFKFLNVSAGVYYLDVCSEGFCRRFAKFPIRMGEAEWTFPPFKLREKYVSGKQLDRLLRLQKRQGLFPKELDLKCEMELCRKEYHASVPGAKECGARAGQPCVR